MAATWFETADELRYERGLSLDDLAFEARNHGGPPKLNSSWISKVRRGQRPLTMELLQGIAGALGVPPETFAEYRLAVARQQLDEREVGLDQALGNLRELEAVATASPKMPGPPKGGFLEQLLEGQQTIAPDQAGAEKPAAGGRRRRSSRKRAA